MRQLQKAVLSGSNLCGGQRHWPRVMSSVVYCMQKKVLKIVPSRKNIVLKMVPKLSQHGLKTVQNCPENCPKKVLKIVLKMVPKLC
jgi:hypothetical protein